ncbi:hypothetical protein HPB51_007365 [Rhipicephalus microplus]|uniref:Nose resistant-to-fluoxetine protein N-terminal domain-containing protein n=1 Tax=Rhipicephalus microplus TaxID=6941 RepID=A0A9J6EFS6_RHIMP|nr:uncharacterized protein LOC119161977 [Rhipicephalus microplus]KAH8033114.1 hypothetical protein HPB51_007365 [Rhipicephalus microplus]
MTSRRSAKCSPPTSHVFARTVFLCALATSCLCDGETDFDFEAGLQPNVSYVAKLREFVGNAMDNASPRLAQKVLQADLSVDCSIGLFKMVRGIRNIDPWALRLLDASGKYPTGALSTTRVDLGSFDECVETVVHDEFGHEALRAQYCNLLIYAGNKTDLDDHITKAVMFAHPRTQEPRICNRDPGGEDIQEIVFPASFDDQDGRRHPPAGHGDDDEAVSLISAMLFRLYQANAWDYRRADLDDFSVGCDGEEPLRSDPAPV